MFNSFGTLASTVSRRIFGRQIFALASATATAAAAAAAAATTATGAAFCEESGSDGGGSSATTAAATEPSRERTFIAVKPDGVHRGLIGSVISRFETRGFKLVGLKQIAVPRALAEKHYAEHEGKPFYPPLVDFLSSGPVVAMVWEGTDVVKTTRTMIGATKPNEAAPGTIRADLAVDIGKNIVHGSDGTENAEREITLWFRPDELVEWTPAAIEWVY